MQFDIQGMRDCCQCPKSSCQPDTTTLSPQSSGTKLFSLTRYRLGSPIRKRSARLQYSLSRRSNIQLHAISNLSRSPKKESMSTCFLYIRVANLFLKDDDVFKFFKQQSIMERTSVKSKASFSSISKMQPFQRFLREPEAHRLGWRPPN